MTRGEGALGVLVAAVVACASLSACGTEEEPSSQGSSESSASPDESASESASESTSESTESAEPSAYLPVPDGVELSDQGSDLSLRESAVVAWEPRQSQVGVLDVVVKRVERTTFADSFQGWELDAAARKSTPYFVRATIANVGESSLGGRAVPLYAVGPADILVQASSFQARFEPCPGNGVFPKDFRPGESAEFCLVYLVPDGGTMSSVSFRPTQAFDPITWTGRITEPEPEKKKPAAP